LEKNGFSTYLIRRLRVHGSADVLGGVKGSFPVNGLLMPPTGQWPLASSAPLPGKDEVHVWRMVLDAPLARVERLRQTVAAEELARAERFRFEKDRRRFTVARGTLRAILSRYLSIPPGRLRFLYGPRGKPRLAEETGGSRLRFNLAHSHGRALCVVTAHREVGIDLERIVPDIEDDLITTHLFSSGEVAAFSAFPPERRLEMFYRFWTQKEAYVKGTGDGLHLRLDQFEVAFAPGEPPALRGVVGFPEEAARWSLHELHPWPGYAAALAVEGHDVRMTCREWSLDAM
jgi:4'-phosphopantetheinyl transferase